MNSLSIDISGLYKLIQTFLLRAKIEMKAVFITTPIIAVMMEKVPIIVYIQSGGEGGSGEEMLLNSGTLCSC